MRIESSKISIANLKLFAFHGVLPQERVVGANYILNIAIDTDFSWAMTTDKLDVTISYAEVYEVVKAEMAVPSKLLEHVAFRICRALFDRFLTAKTIHLEILKENPPMGADCAGAGICVDVSR